MLHFLDKQIFAKQRELEQVILKACPNMPRSAGIYFYTRTDEDGKYAYIGKSVDLLKRSVSHLQGYQHIDLSIKKHGLLQPILVRSKPAGGYEIIAGGLETQLSNLPTLRT